MSSHSTYAMNTLLPTRLNAEPPIFRGCSLSELMSLLTLSGIILMPLSIIVCSLFGFVMMGVGIGLLLVMVSMVLMATGLQKLKRGKPVGYYQLRLRLWLDDIAIYRAPFIREGQVWDIGRRVT